MGQRSSLSSPESANPFAIKPMTGARNSTRLNYVPMGLVVAQERRGDLTFRPRAGRARPTGRRDGAAFLRGSKTKDTPHDFLKASPPGAKPLLGHRRGEE